ncbi:YdeI/OmpD-associated family protein [Qipengyuania sp.]|uniref:YdeI/OmpD-associated family protein n=1 Tax=Qipengyuania sp. TaxID=2004515 RepID=UPI003BAD7BB6
MERDSRVDAYIAKAQPFARPILEHLRSLAERAEPEAQEDLRWGAPFWILDGRQLCGMAAFKAHCAFVIEGPGGGEAMGDLGRITALDDLPPDEKLVRLLKEKAQRIRSGEDKAAKAKPKPKPEIAMPDDFAAALEQTSGAEDVWNGFTDAQRRDYLQWITGAKREATRTKRIATAAEWIGEGKRRNWKYESC